MVSNSWPRTRPEHFMSPSLSHRPQLFEHIITAETHSPSALIFLTSSSCAILLVPKVEASTLSKTTSSQAGVRSHIWSEAGHWWVGGLTATLFVNDQVLTNEIKSMSELICLAVRNNKQSHLNTYQIGWMVPPPPDSKRMVAGDGVGLLMFSNCQKLQRNKSKRQS